MDSAPDLDNFLSAYSPEVRELALKARAPILEVIPGAVEIVDAPSKIVAYGLGRKYADLVCAIQPQKSYVNLIFSKGASLPDPQGLLEGTGKKARSLLPVLSSFSVISLAQDARTGLCALWLEFLEPCYGARTAAV
ncbi:MAG TPA: DUF1801 domain-containing protein [Anaerolineaceae bacterium]|nr:DUF1801 domain-containing protein [Anaerolineaceae bacterium]